MRRFREYLKFITWQTGIGYLLLWMVTLWTLDEGASVFGNSGVCYPDTAAVLFYWVCAKASPLSILASVANAALTATVWAPVYIAAATVGPEAISIAVPIVLLHVVGLPLGLFVLIRMLTNVLDLRRNIRPSREPARASMAAAAARPTTTPSLQSLSRLAAPQPTRKVKARSEFGLRSDRIGAGNRRSQDG